MKNLMMKLEKFLNKYLLPLANAVNDNKVMTAMRDGMMATLPITLIASTTLILSNFPFLGDKAPALDAALKRIFGPISPVTLGILSIYMIIAIARAYSKSEEVDSVSGIMCALASFFIITPFTATTDVMVNGELVKGAVVNGIIPTGSLGATGVFTSLIVTFLSIKILSFLQHKNFTIKMPDSVPPNVAKPFLAVIPFGGALMVFLAVRLLFEQTGYVTLQKFIEVIITKPFLNFGSNIWVYLFILVMSQILWFFGIHGTNLLQGTVWTPIATILMAANLEAFNAGKPLPYALTAAFGAYAVQAKLSEIVALCVFGKSKQAKTISKLALVPAIFNIHEPFVFGLPVIMNTTLLIPWIFVESIQAGLAYVLVKVTGAVAIFQAPWTAPPILQQLIATNFNPWSIVISIATFALGFFIWTPFIKILDNQLLEKEREQELVSQGNETVEV